MKVSININRVFRKTSQVVREKPIRLEGDHTLSSVISTFGWKLCVLAQGSIAKATSRLRLYHRFGTYLSVMNRRHGPEFVVKYLKASSLALSKFLAGEPFKSLREIEPDLPLPRLTKSGLPVIIGTRDRRSLHANSHRVIRLWLTLFGLYKIIIIPAKSKLNTITDPFSGNQTFLEIVGNWMEHKAPSVLQRFQDDISLEKVEQFSMGEKASPSNSKSWMGMLSDISLLKNCPSVFNSLRYVMDFTLGPGLIEIFDNLSKIVPDVSSPKFEHMNFIQKDSILMLFQEWNVSFYDAFRKWKYFGLGQLQTKVEPAGKMRVFAMVDSWTQTVLLPLHTYLTKLLKEFGNDGTDSHNAAFQRVMERSVEYGCSFGYDLSAATDRLPISLQIKLLSGLFSKEFANHWANILIGRPYYLIDNQTKKGGFTEAIPFWYAVGQPMGARSSFTMLGLTHHMLVQYAAHLLDPHSGWEDRYEIVGDDIIIFNEDLANSYLKVMELIGVPINRSKSVIARNKPVAEFVKRICLNGKDVSAFSWKQFISQDNFLGRISTTIGLFQKEISLAEKAISVFHTIIKEKIYDTRFRKDSLALVTLFLTYALKSNMSIQNILRAIFLQNPVVDGPRFIFENFNFYEIEAKVKRMIQTGRTPVDMSFHPEVLAINHFMTGLNFSRVLKLRESWWVNKIRANQQMIIRRIMGGLWDSFNTSQITLDIREELLSWMRYQDPLLGTKGYPWLTWCEDLSYMTERYMTLNHLEVAYRLYQECLGKLSFLKIHERIGKVEKPVVFGNVDPALLRDIAIVSKKVAINRAKHDAIKDAIKKAISSLS